MPPRTASSSRTTTQKLSKGQHGNKATSPSSRSRAASVASSSTAVSAPASRPLSLDEADRHSGVFVYVNGLLCRTADSTGRFCPRDVFGGVDRFPARAPFELPPVKDDDDDNPAASRRRRRRRRRDDDNAQDTLGFETDCPIFNTFGVLTGGVLIDPFAGTFADYTQSAPYTVSGIEVTSSTSAASSSGGKNSATQQIHHANELNFRNGNFSNIRPVSALTLCTSELTLPPAAPYVPLEGDESTRSFFFSHKKVVSALKPQRINSTAESDYNVEAWRHKVVFPDGMHPQDKERLLKTWRNAEGFRRSLMNASVARAVYPQGFFPPSIPFLYRERGLPATPDTSAQGGGQNSPALPSDINSEVAAAPVPGVRSTASSFVCYSGQPRFAVEMANPTRSTLTDHIAPPLALKLRKRLRPYDPENVKVLQDASAEEEEQQFIAQSLGAQQLDATTEELEYYLKPYTTTKPRVAVFWLFYVYFNHLGLVCNGIRITGETVEASAPKRDTENFDWSLCPENEYVVEAEIRKKRAYTRELWLRANTVFPGGGQWSTTGRNHTLVADAFAVLMRRSRDALLRRLHALNVYLHELNKERPIVAK